MSHKGIVAREATLRSLTAWALALFLTIFLVAPLGAQSQNQTKAEGAAPPAAQNQPKADQVDPPVRPPYRSVQEIAKPRLWDTSDQQVEVLYFFWYGCPTCKLIDAQVSEMARSLPPGIRFKKLPAAFEENPEWQAHARLFWALDSLGLEEGLHQDVFLAVQPGEEVGHGPVQLLTPDSQKAFARAHKIDARKFAAALDSQVNQLQLKKTFDYLDSVALGSVPSFIVNGRYIVNIESRRPLTDFLNEAARLAKEELAKRSPAPEAGQDKSNLSLKPGK
ncbi:MAG: thiol:disulfide interchange protein DsbA/DsbL [Deltaproteobacteria bacterium]|jgi:thiol:disulfide interchange protein DsbA|nr:thiol:disulfide interchange protein DsbA/DsbL [Deltaproteobacteria bacterium]